MHMSKNLTDKLKEVRTWNFTDTFFRDTLEKRFPGVDFRQLTRYLNSGAFHCKQTAEWFAAQVLELSTNSSPNRPSWASQTPSADSLYGSKGHWLTSHFLKHANLDPCITCGWPWVVVEAKTAVKKKCCDWVLARHAKQESKTVVWFGLVTDLGQMCALGCHNCVFGSNDEYIQHFILDHLHQDQALCELVGITLRLVQWYSEGRLTVKVNKCLDQTTFFLD